MDHVRICKLLNRAVEQVACSSSLGAEEAEKESYFELTEAYNIMMPALPGTLVTSMELCKMCSRKLTKPKTSWHFGGMRKRAEAPERQGTKQRVGVCL